MNAVIARYGLKNLVEMIDEPNRSKCRKILKDSLSLFKKAYGSTHNHQNWPGGYYDHITEVTNQAVYRYRTNPRLLPFSLSDALLVSFLHDIEKPWKYEIGPDGELRHNSSFKTGEDQHIFVGRKLREYGIVLSAEHENALRYVHGEGDDYSSKRRVAGPLAAFCHICDYWIARIDFDCPMVENDPWLGAKRARSSS